MRLFTVVLLRPEYLTKITKEKYGLDIYVALVTVSEQSHALAAAQCEVFRCDCADGLKPKNVGDYKLCVMFAGHQEALRYGWQTF